MATEDSAETEAEGWRRWWNQLGYAGEWVFDTFRGHSGMEQLKDQET